MTTLSPVAPLYYRHSGRFTIPGVAGGLPLCVAAAIVVGAIYAYVDLYIPIGGWITFLITAGAGWAVGSVVSRCIRVGKIRNVPVALGMAGIAAVALVASSWEFYVFALLQKGNVPISFFRLLFDPHLFGKVVGILNEKGTFSIHDASPTGIFLTLLWVLEAGILVVIPIKAALKAIHELPFCEQCNRWCGTRALANILPGNSGELRNQLERRNFEALVATGKAPAVARFFNRVYLQGCSGCDSTQTLCVDQITITADSKGRLKTAAQSIIRRLRLSPEDTVAVATAVAGLAAVPVPQAAGAAVSAGPAAASQPPA